MQGQLLEVGKCRTALAHLHADCAVQGKGKIATAVTVVLKKHKCDAAMILF